VSVGDQKLLSRVDELNLIGGWTTTNFLMTGWPSAALTVIGR
jgi:hypothetical protein